MTTAQFAIAGLTRRAVAGRVERGWLRPMHRGVHFVGHGEISQKARAMAAALAIGQGAFVSHRSAACLYGFLPDPTEDRPVEVTVTGRRLGPRPDIAIHRATTLDHRDTRLLDNIPITSPARTLLDLAATSPGELDEAFDEAVFKRTVRVPQLADVLERSRGRPGVAALRRLVDAESDGSRNRLEAERRFAALVTAAKLPEPRPNVTIGRFVVDFLWPRHRAVAEVDGFATHRRRRVFEGDRARDGDLQALDYRVVRITWRQLTGEPYAVVARVAAVLALAGRHLAPT